MSFLCLLVNKESWNQLQKFDKISKFRLREDLRSNIILNEATYFFSRKDERYNFDLFIISSLPKGKLKNGYIELDLQLRDSEWSFERISQTLLYLSLLEKCQN